MRLIGLDAASDRAKFGYAIGVLEGDCVRVEQAGLLSDAGGPIHSLIVPALLSAPAALIAIDAPLGWPDGLRGLVGGHRAGSPPRDTCKNDCFRRATDVQVHQLLGKMPLEIGADRIARAAYEALLVIGELREKSGLPIPLAWQSPHSGVAAIEVYPAATLTAHGYARAPYKKPEHGEERIALATSLKSRGLIEGLDRYSSQRVDVFDAGLCLLAAADFFLGRCTGPTAEQFEQAQREGWIWVARKD